jgi:cell division protein FtsB
MFNKLTYRHKNRIMVWGSLLFLVVIYMFSIRRTINLIGENKTLRGQIEVAHSAPGQIEELKAASGIFERQIDALENQEVFRTQLLNNVGDICKNNLLILKGFNEAGSFEENGLVIENHLIDLQGEYPDLVKAIYELEKHTSTGRIVSARFYIDRDRRTKREFLVASLIIQTINRKSNENN